MSKFEVTPRTKLKRLPVRGIYDKSHIYSILDEALICHIGFVHDDQPYVIPTIHARIDDTLYIHGSSASRMIRALSEGIPACVTVTLIDGLVLARSVFHHSMNYRSAVMPGTLKPVTDPAQKLSALEAIVEHVIPGRSTEARKPNRKELKATAVMSMKIDEASAKVRSGPPGDDEDDYALPVWAGVIPLTMQPGVPVPDDLLDGSIEIPDYIRQYRRR